MPLLDGFRKLFTSGRKPVAIDMTDAQNGAHGGQEDQNLPQPEDGGNLVAVERRASKPRSMAELQRGYEEVMGLVRKVSDHLDTQTQRTEKLVKLMEHLPQALEALPEVNRQNARLLEVLNEHLSQSKSREDALNATLRSLGDNSSQQTEVLGLLQQQFDVSTRSAEKMTDTLGGFSDALSNLATTNNRSAEILSRIVDSAEERETRMATMVSRNEKWNWAIVGLLGLAVILLAIIGLSMLQGS